MSKEIAFHNGEFISADQLVVRPQDMGFMLGVTVAEQMRTFNGKLFEVEPHIKRLQRSLEIVGVADVDTVKLVDAAQQVVEHNYGLLAPNSDLGLTVFVTPGLYPTYAPDGERHPNIGVHSYPLPFSLWAEKYDSGQACEIVSVTQISSTSWPRGLKCRSRMHYHLADREAKQQSPGASAILLDELGNINETPTANVLAYFENEGLVSPPLESILPGISLRYVERLAKTLGSKFTYRPISVEEFLQADEILLASTPFCLLPVSQLGDKTLHQRDCFHWLLKAWSKDVNLDIRSQAVVNTT